MRPAARHVMIDVLGPLRVRDEAGRDLTPSGPLQRRLLAVLVLRRGRVVSVDAAVEALWPATLPADPAAALQNHVSRLRRSLPEGAIESLADGYRLDPALVDVDADRLSNDLGLGETADGDTVAEIEAVLARWKGPAYPELDELDEAAAEAARLEELRTRAVELRAAVRLARGDTDGLAAELVTLTDAEPLRERPRALLMATLVATGRHAEALRVYDDFRRVLGDELGIVPSPALTAQHAELLAGTWAPEWAAASRLPVPATSLLGRDELAADVTASTRTARLVTLVGPGGVGKTRLLVEVGRRLRAAHPTLPVVLCELATADATAAVDVVAAALDIDRRPGTLLVDRIVDVVGDSELVLLLDNCEHVLDEAAEMAARLLTTCPQVRVVATSRERLRVEGEHVRQVPTLPCDDDNAAGLQLFVERARAARPGFQPGTAELAVIAEIVRRLDGLPLAIELAAARLHTHELDEIEAGLVDRFRLLSSGYRTSSRHGSLSAAVEWSFGLLEPHLQETFANLSAFTGAFTAADAAAVCAADSATVAGSLAQLVERSLVMRAPGRRYVLLETLRAFGAEELARSGRVDEVAERHARHHVDWVERADHRMQLPGESAIADIESAIPELRSALGWLLDHGQVELAGRLVTSLLDYSFLRLRPDVFAWAERVVAADPDDRSPRAAHVWVLAAYAAWMAGDLDESIARGERAVRIAQRAGGVLPAEVTTIKASNLLFLGEVEQAATLYGEAAAAAAATADPVEQLMALASEVMALGYAGHPRAAELSEQLLAQVADVPTPYTAYVWYCAGEADLAVDVERARSRLAEAIRIAELTHASFVTGVAGASKASIDARIGDPQAAADDYRRLIIHWRKAGMWSTQWTVLRSIAGLLARLGRHRDAAVLEGAVRSTAEGHRIFGADEVALDELGALLREALGDSAYEAARRRGAVLDGDAAVEHALRAL